MFEEAFTFNLARLPSIVFGCGMVKQLPALLETYGQHVLLVTGSQSFQKTPHWSMLIEALTARSMTYSHEQIVGEPTAQAIDAIVARQRQQSIDVIAGIGGGSAMDAAKAIAGLLQIENSVMDFLEGVGPELPYQGPAVPWIAVPTTAGTGSEATKNAVLSQHGLDGFKKSFRDEQLVAATALVDPDLLASCPRQVIAANGMDALTQLLESFVSIKANVFNNSLGRSGLKAIREGLLSLYHSQGQDAQAREKMAFASLASGINLAQTGLGSVHGLASPLGAFYPIPHGIVCGTLVGAATRMNIQALQQRAPDNVALDLYAEASQILHGRHFRQRDEALNALVVLLDDWTNDLQIETLSAYGIEESAFDHIIANCRGSSMKTNPIVLTDEEIRTVLQQRL